MMQKKSTSAKEKDKDDFFITTDERIYHYIKSKGFNIMLQDNDHAIDDGSLSIYAARNGISYLNVEAQHGHLKEQLEMLDLVCKMITEKHWFH